MNRRHWLWIGGAVLLVAALIAIFKPKKVLVPETRPAAPAASTRPAKIRVPPPLFGPWYVEALRAVPQLEESDAAALEAHVRREPGDEAARLKLMAYAMRGDQQGSAQSRARRAKHALWLIEHKPESEILHSPYAMFLPGQLTDEEYRRASALWEQALGAAPSDARVVWNAASFYAELDAQRQGALLEKLVTLAPTNENYGRPLGLRYAQAIVDASRAGRLASSPTAAAAIAALERSPSTGVVEAAVRLLQSEYNSSLMFGRENKEMGEMAARFFRRAEKLDPELDRAWVYPQLERRLVGSMAPGAAPPVPADWAADAEKAVRRLSVAAFPELPEVVAETLKQRGCQIPQSRPEAGRVNAVRGEFFAKDKSGWAVLCSVDGHSAILVFRSDVDRAPVELAKAEDKNYFQNDGASYFYSREIRAVGHDFIVGHYRAYGGPKPPPIDHQGIDDAFLEKASVTYYWHDGEWIQLQGAD